MTLAEMFRRLIAAGVPGAPVVRGRVHKIGIVAGGEVSVVLRFGVDEPNARWLHQGSLVALQEIRRGEVHEQGKSGSSEA